MPRRVTAGILHVVPTYDYRCERTGEMFELWQSFSDDSLTVCPQTHDGEDKVCGAEVKKVFSKVGIAFKGDGFYKNDHGSSSKPSSTATSESQSSGSTSGDSKSDSSTSTNSSADSNGSSNSSSSTATSTSTTAASSDS